MKHIIDLTKSNFDKMDFTEAEIMNFDYRPEPPPSISFPIWGGVLLVSPMWKHRDNFEDGLKRTDELYVAGKGIIRINRLIGGNIRIAHYDKVRDAKGRTQIAKTSGGEDQVFKRTWPCATGSADEYLWECVISQPYGFCVLRLLSEGGKVTYEFDDKDMIPLGQYLENPKVYSYNRRTQ